MNSFSPIKS